MYCLCVFFWLDLRVRWTESESTVNTAEIEIFKEDHTIANLIRKYVIFLLLVSK